MTNIEQDVIKPLETIETSLLNIIRLFNKTEIDKYHFEIRQLEESYCIIRRTHHNFENNK